MSRRRLQPAVSLDVARAPDVRTLPQERGAIRRAGRGHVVTIGEVVARFHELRAAGALEDTLLAAYRGHNGPVAAPGVLHFLFRSADRARLRAAGDPLPHAGPFVLYRGRVADGPVRGISWTASRTVARFFALRPAPAGALREVWRSTVQNSQIYCRLPLANEFLADVGEVSLFEQGTAAIAAGLRRDGVDAEALAVLRDGRRERPDIGTLTLAIRLGILRQDPILEHLATTLATAGQDSDGRSGPLRRGRHTSESVYLER